MPEHVPPPPSGVELPPTAIAPGLEAWMPPRPGNALIVVMVAAGAIFLVAGVITLQAPILLERPQFGDIGYESWVQTVRLILFLGTVLADVGVLLLIVIGFLAAIARRDLPDGVRRSLVIGPIALAIAWLIVFVLLVRTLFVV